MMSVKGKKIYEIFTHTYHNVRTRIGLFPSKFPHDSWLRCLFELRSIDSHERYNIIAKLLEQANCYRILDVGSGGLSPLSNMGFEVISIDIKPRMGVNVVASATCLPFRSSSFECVTAVDSLEHIDSCSRVDAILEIKRVGRLVIIHVPLQDDKIFMGRFGDHYFLEEIRKHNMGAPIHYIEHLTCREPRPEELEKYGFHYVCPDWNINVWITFMTLQYRTGCLINLVLVPFYFFLLRHVNMPPWWGAYLITRAE